MPNYPYKVRVLAGLDSLLTPGRATAVPYSSIETAVHELCNENDISLPSSWKKRLQLTLDALVSEGWLSRKKDNNAYLPTPQLRKIVADQKLRLNVSHDTHDLKTFSAISRKLRSTEAQEVEDDESDVPNPTPNRSRRRSPRLSIVSPDQRDTEAGDVPSSPSEGSVIEVRDANVHPARSRKSRHSDPGPIITGPVSSTGRRASGITGSQPSSQPPTRKRNTNRRHTLAVNPTRQPKFVPSGAPKELQFIPLRQALSSRARRALRRSALSEEMNNIEAEEKAGRKKNREELARLRSELAASSARLERLEQLLAEARHAPSQEPELVPLSPIREENYQDEEMPDADLDMDFGVDYEDNTPEPEFRPEAEREMATPFRSSPARSTDGPSPTSTRDQRINELEAEIAQLRDNIRLQADEARRREEEDEEFHDAEEQILLEENVHLTAENTSLSNKLRQYQAPGQSKSVAFDESTMVETESVVEEVAVDGTEIDIDDNVSLVSDHMPYTSSGVDSGIATMDVDIPDSRIIELETNNEQLQKALDSVKAKLYELEIEFEETVTGSEESARDLERLRKENETLCRLADKLQLRIVELEELEGERLENIGYGVVQTDPVLDGEKQALECKVVELQELTDELEHMVDRIGAEKRQLEIAVAECHAHIKGLEHAVEAESGEKVEALSLATGLKKMAEDLRGRAETLSEEKQEMAEELDTLNLESEKIIDTLKSENATLHQEIKSKNVVINDLSEQLKVLTLRASDFETKLDASLEEVRNLKGHVVEKDATIESLKVKIANLDDEKSAQVAALKTEKSEVNKLGTQVVYLEEVNKTLEHANSAFQSDILSLQELNDSLESANESLDDELAAAKAEINDLENQLEVMETRADNAEDAKEDFEQNIDRLRTQVDMLEKAAVESEKDRKSLERDTERLQKLVTSKAQELEGTSQEKGILQDELLAAQTQIDSFKQAALAASREHDQMNSKISDLHAQIEAFKKAKILADKERENIQKEIDDLNDRVDGLLVQVEAAKTEKELMERDIANYQSTIERLNELLDISQNDNAALRETIAQLESEVASLESNLGTSNANNTDLQEEILRLNEQITAMKRSAEAADDEKRIIAQKIGPYVLGEQPLDMAIDEVLTELAMAKNRVVESERLHAQLQQKIRILAREEGVAAEEAVERLTDRFRDVRDRVEALYLRRRQEAGESSMQGHQLEDFAWTGSNEYALQVLGRLVEDMDKKLVTAKQGAQVLQQALAEENMRGTELEDHLRDVVACFGDESLVVEQEGIPAFVKLQVSELEGHIATAETRLAELNDSIKEKDATISHMQMDLDVTAEDKANLEDKLNDVLSSRTTITSQLEKAGVEINELNAVVEEKDDEIDELETELVRRHAEEQQLVLRMEEQTAAYKTAAQEQEQKRIAEIQEVEDKLAEALAAKSEAEIRLRDTTLDKEATIKDLDELVSASRVEVGRLNAQLEEMKVESERALDSLQKDLEAAIESRNDLGETLTETKAKYIKDMKIVESELTAARAESADRINALEAIISERDARTKQLSSELAASVSSIKQMEDQIDKIKYNTQEQQDELEGTIALLRVELANTKINAASEQQRLEKLVAAHAEQLNALQIRASDLERFLNEAEASEAQLTDDLKESEAKYQLLVENSNIERQALTSHKNALKSELKETREAKAVMEKQLKEDIVALEGLVDRKKARIEQLELYSKGLETDNGELLAQLTNLKSEKTQLEEDLAEERQKALEAMQDLQGETAKFLARFGDVKNLYVKESKLRESKKRGHKDVEEVSVEERLAQVPPTPTSTLRRLSVLDGLRGEGSQGSSKRRRFDSGIGIGVDEEDEGFEGSTMMSA